MLQLDFCTRFADHDDHQFLLTKADLHDDSFEFSGLMGQGATCSANLCDS